MCKNAENDSLETKEPGSDLSLLRLRLEHVDGAPEATL